MSVMPDIYKPVEFPRDHELITRLIANITRGISRKYFPRQPAYHQSELALLPCHVILGHVERRPANVSKLARSRSP
jgi:hypothetical protein